MHKPAPGHEAPAAVDAPPADPAPADPAPAGETPAVERPTVGTDGIPLTGKLVDADAWKLAQASMIAGALSEPNPEEEALQAYPDLQPPIVTRASDARASASATGATTAATIPGLTPEETQYSQDYTKGFALGYVEAYAKAYTAARDTSYGPAWQDGWKRGQAEYHRLSGGSPADGIDLARKAMLTGHFQEAVNRLDIVIASPASTAVLDVALYWKAAAYYYWGKYQPAIDAARQVVEIANSQHADDAYFLLGASYESWKEGGFFGMFAHRHDAEAATNYEIAATKFAGSRGVPRALLHLGGCRERLRQRTEAIAAYQRLSTEFASAPEAVKAKARLQALHAR